MLNRDDDEYIFSYIQRDSEGRDVLMCVCLRSGPPAVKLLPYNAREKCVV